MTKKESIKNTFNSPLTGEGSNAKPLHDEGVFSPLIFQTDNVNHAEFLQKQGQKQLSEGDIKGLKYFDLASELDPTNDKLFFEQGLSLFAYGKETKTKKYLLLACKKFKMSTKLNPAYFASWQLWGNTLFFLGREFKQYHFFLEARNKYLSALSLTKGQSDVALGDLYWDFGKVITEIAEHSGEVSDLNEALEAHAKATSYNEDLPAKFWQDFGNVSLKLGMQIKDIRLYLKAINCHKNAISKSISNYESWYFLGYALSELYELTHDEDHFCQANECFTSSAKLHPQNSNIWVDWAELLLRSGKRLNDPKRLHSSIEKCHRAYSCNRKNQKIILIWSEALTFLGILTERLDLIYEGHNKIVEKIENLGPTPDSSLVYGQNLYAFAKYYNDLDYYYQAIEKYQEGLSLDRTHHKLWHSLAYTYTIVAEIEDDLSLYERASKFYCKAISLQSESTYHYDYAVSLRKLAETTREKDVLEKSLNHFEQAFLLQKNAVYLQPKWLYQYAMALDLMGDFADEDVYYIKAIEILKRVLMIDPDFPEIHYHIALVYSHLGELSEQIEVYQRAISHYKISFQNSEENENLILDWALAIINLSEITPSTEEREELYREAEYKLTQAAKLGNPEVYYHLGCLYSLMRQYEKALFFLEKAEQFEALPPIDEVLEDSWLENLRQTELFRSFINHLQNID